MEPSTTEEIRNQLQIFEKDLATLPIQKMIEKAPANVEDNLDEIIHQASIDLVNEIRNHQFF